MRIFVILVAGIVLAASSLLGADLYEVRIGNALDAQRLAAVGVEPVVKLADGYLVLIDASNAELPSESGLQFVRVATGVSVANLALDNRKDRANITRYPLVFERDGIRLYKVERAVVAKQAESQIPDLRMLNAAGLRITYEEQRVTALEMLHLLPSVSAPLDSLIGLVSQDSLQTDLLTLQAFAPRVAGTAANISSRNWIYDQLTGFGYDSVVYDSFTASVSGGTKMCYNVMATKVGTVYPNHYVIIGAHRDAVTGSPGADDNGSGTIAVMEIARVLRDIPTDMTIIFALYDAEEYGLYGSYHHAAEVQARGDSLVYMLNMDMIGHFENSTDANLYHGSNTEFSNLWITLADSLVGITGHLAGTSSGSDHYPFTQYGYPATFNAEYIFSTVYHSYRDSTSYMNFPYMTKLVKACLATGYAVSQTAGPRPSLVLQISPQPPELLDPSGPTVLGLTISSVYDGVMVPGSGKLHYSVDGGAYAENNLILLSGDQYQVVLPQLACTSDVKYYFTVEETTTGTVTYPDLAHPYRSIVASSFVSLYDDNFESDRGWTVSGDALDGQWSRGIPVGLGERGDPAADFDGSGQCFLTDNVYGNSDVDNGTTYLVSPSIDLSQGNALVTYALWFSNSFGAAPNEDIFRVWISNNNGSTWTVADQVGPTVDANGGWHVRSFWAGDLVTPTSQMRLRFEAADLISGSVVEAAIDAITIRRFECAPPSCCTGTRGNVNLSASETPDLSDLSWLISYLTVVPKPELPCPEEADVNGTGAANPDLSDLSLLIGYLTQSPRPALPNCP
jgi:hypothetical protein